MIITHVSLPCLYQYISIDIFISICGNSQVLSYHNSQELSFLSKTELEWLLGKKQLSGPYNRKIKSQVKKKLENFEKFELPLLVEKGLISLPNVTKFRNGVTNYSNDVNQSLKFDSEIINNFAAEFNKNFQYNSQNYANLSGPDVIRTRDPRHVKAVS